MNLEHIQKLAKHKVISDPFDYEYLEKEIAEKYKFCEQRFEKLLFDRANHFELRDCYFFIKSDNRWNAFAQSIKGYNIIGITNGYAIQMFDVFNEKHFSSIILVALLNKERTSAAYADLYKQEAFELNKFMLDCSIQFTFGHEFQHILQFNSSKIVSKYYRSENQESTEFDIQKHIWEFDADRFASFELLKYIFEVKRTKAIKSDDMFKCMLFLGLASIFITKIFFYLGVRYTDQSINKVPFYTKKFSHPHPLVRIINIIDYFFDNALDLFPDSDISKQDLLNNTLGIAKIYFDSFLRNQDVISEMFRDLDLHLDVINSYNEELFDLAIKEESIRNLLIARRINLG